MGEALADHHEGAGAELFDVACEKERLAEALVAGDGTVGVAEALGSQGRRQFSGIPDLDAIGKHAYLNRTSGDVVAMGDGVDDGFADHVGWDFVTDRGLHALRSGADTAIELGENKVEGHVHLLEDRAFEDAVEGNRADNVGAVEVHAPDFGTGQEALRIATEQQDGSLGGPAFQQQVEMSQQIGHTCAFRQRELPFFPGLTDECGDSFGVHIFQGCSRTRLIFEGECLHQPFRGEVIHEAGVERGDEFGDIAKAAANELRPSLADQRGHAGMTVGIRAFDKDEALFARGGGAVELAVGWRKAFSIRSAVFEAEDTDVKGAAVHLAQVNFVCSSVRGGKLLKKHDLEKPTQEGIALDKGLHRPALGGEFRLDAGDEDGDGHGCVARASSALRS